MKKGLLLLITALAVTFSVSAQEYWKSNYPFASTEYPEWNTTLDTFLVGTAGSDSLWIVDGLMGLTDFSKADENGINITDGMSWSVPWGTRYALATSGDELHVTFKPSISSDEWSIIQCNTFKWIGAAPAVDSVKMGGSKIGGFLVDFQPTDASIDNGTISLDVFVPGKLNSSTLNVKYVADTFAIRVSIFDAHGHEWNHGGDAFAYVTEFDKWTTIAIDYNDAVEGTFPGMTDNPGDGYGRTWHGMVNKTVPGNAGASVPIDFTKVAGIRIYLSPDNVPADDTFDGEVVKIKNIVIGDADYAVPFKLWEKPISSDEEVAADVSGEITSIEVLNLLGQTVDVVETIEEVPAGLSILKVTLEDGTVVTKKAAIVK